MSVRNVTLKKFRATDLFELCIKNPKGMTSHSSVMKNWKTESLLESDNEYNFQ